MLSKAIIWFGTSYAAAILGYLAVNASAARLLREEFGYFVVTLTVSTVLGQLGLVGAHRGGLREAARLRSHDTAGLLDLRRAVWVVSAVTLPLTAVVSAVAAFLVASNADDTTRWVLAVGTGLLVWLGGEQKLWANYLRGFGRVRLASLFEGRSGGALIAVTQGLLLGGVLLLAPSLGLAGALAAMAAGFAVPVLLAWRLVSRTWRHVPLGRVTWRHVRHVVYRHRHFASTMLGGSLNSYLETWIAGLLLVSVDVSLFSASQRLSVLLTISVMSMGVVFNPVVSRLADREDPRLEPLLRTGASLAALLTGALWVPMLVAPGWLLGTVFGAPFGEGAVILLVLTLGSIANVLTGMCSVPLTMSRHEAVVARLQWAAVAARVILGIVLASTFGSIGLAVSAASVSTSLSVALWYVTRRRMGLWTHPTLRPDLGLLRRTAG